MNTPVYEVILSESLPDLKLWVSTDGTLLDGLDSDYSFELNVFDPDETTVLFSKQTGFTGQAGTGTESSGTPNLIVQWATAGELDQLTGGRSHKALLELTRLSDSRILPYLFVIKAVALPSVLNGL